jgi:hypothetical protein
MAMTTKDFFKRRIYQARIERHNGNQDDLGSPTYTNALDWDAIITGWPCELLTTAGGESIRGRTVTANTTHVFTGDFWSTEAADIGPDCRVMIRGKTYSIVKVWQPDGLNSQMFIEAKQSW